MHKSKLGKNVTLRGIDADGDARNIMAHPAKMFRKRSLTEEGWLRVALLRVLVVEDHEQYRRFICSTLKERPELQIVQVSDGLQAVRRAEELQPALIVLDIGLPSLNGIEVALRIRRLSPESRILFLSQESSVDVVREALAAGASGYVYKPDAGSELLAAVSAVLRGERFVGARFSGHNLVRGSDAIASRELSQPNAGKPHRTGRANPCIFMDMPTRVLPILAPDVHSDCHAQESGQRERDSCFGR